MAGSELAESCVTGGRYVNAITFMCSKDALDTVDILKQSVSRFMENATPFLIFALKRKGPSASSPSASSQIQKHRNYKQVRGYSLLSI